MHLVQRRKGNAQIFWHLIMNLWLRKHMDLKSPMRKNLPISHMARKMNKTALGTWPYIQYLKRDRASVSGENFIKSLTLNDIVLQTLGTHKAQDVVIWRST